MLRLFRLVFAVAILWPAAPTPALSAGDPLLFAVQEALADEGYDPGVPDGISGPRTAGAIEAFQSDFALSVTGTVTPELVQALGLASYAAELGVMRFDNVRTLAPPVGAAGEVETVDASYDTDTRTNSRPIDPPAARPAADSPAPANPAASSPVFRVRQSHPLAPQPTATDNRQPAQATTPNNVVAEPPEAPKVLPANAAAQQQSIQAENRQPEKAPNETPGIPPLAKRFAPRNWLIRDFQTPGSPAAAPFGIFLEEGGKVAGPRFASRLKWQANGARFTMTYRNSIGQEITRTGLLNGLNQIEGEATGPDGKTWLWLAEAKPL